MKRCHFNSWVAKVFLSPSYKAITLVYNSFFKHKVEECKPDDINHECIHQIQQIECSIVGLVLGIILWLSFGISFWWVVALTFGFFYLWYVIEYLIIMCFAKWNKQNERYHDVSFEEEAHNNDHDLEYIRTRKHYSWVKYVKLRSYKK